MYSFIFDNSKMSTHDVIDVNCCKKIQKYIFISIGFLVKEKVFLANRKNFGHYLIQNI